MRERGEAYAKASMSRLRAEELYDAGGSRRPLFDSTLYEEARYREFGASLYVEYGLRSTLTLVASVPFKIADQDAGGRFSSVGEIDGRSYGLGDLHVGARVPLHRGRWVAALEPDLKLPLYGSPDDGNGVSSGPPLGSGFTDLGAALSIGAGFPSWHGYGQASAGYRLRGGSPPDEITWDLEAGLAPLHPVRVRVHYDRVDSRGRSGSGDASGMEAQVPGAGGQDAHRIAPTLALEIPGMAEISVTWRRVVGGRSTIRSSEWEVAFAFLGTVLPSR